jgi:hypothetical protein
MFTLPHLFKRDRDDTTLETATCGMAEDARIRTESTYTSYSSFVKLFLSKYIEIINLGQNEKLSSLPKALENWELNALITSPLSYLLNDVLDLHSLLKSGRYEAAAFPNRIVQIPGIIHSIVKKNIGELCI